MSILETIRGHEDLVGLDDAQRQQLCQEIRRFLVDHVARTGGHLASNLGVVELTVALETVYNTNKDRLVFDVGHQSYVHKLLTGRQADFAQLRQFGGIAGFPKPSESDTDAFVAGHASSSISIALGMARARTMLKEDYDVVTLIGDGATTGGMSYEGLNDLGDSYEPMVVILNDNEMSIDRNVGGMATHLSRLRSKGCYLGMKEKYRRFLRKTPFGYRFYRLTSRMKDWIKRALLHTTIFENMGLTYLGPVDGHDLPSLITLLRQAKEMERPVLLHVITRKGNGYHPAEEAPSKFHGIGKFDPDSGQTVSAGKVTFSDTFGKTLTELARQDGRICAITAAMPTGTGLVGFQQEYPNRLFDVGIAEEHAVSMAGGLAKQGMIPVVALYSTFLQRAYDQIIQDVAILKLHVVFAIDRAGLVGEDGETHHGVFDVGFLRHIPGMRLLAPASCLEQQQMLTWAVKEFDGPVAVRYPRGGDLGYSDSCWDGSADAVCHRRGKDIAIITYGTLIGQALEAAELLAKRGIDAAVIRLLTLSPLPTKQVAALLDGTQKVLIAEEAAAGAGVHEALAFELRKMDPSMDIRAIDLGDHFVTHGSLQQLLHHCGLDAAGIADTAWEVLK